MLNTLPWLLVLALGCATPTVVVRPAEAPSGGPAPSVSRPPTTDASGAPIDADSVMELVRALPADRFPGRAGHAAARTWLSARVEALGLEPRWTTFAWEGLPGVELANLEVRLGTAGGPLVVAGAHYDSVPGTHGADDNGSGVAALLEIARRMTVRELPGELRLVWFDAEESGLVGSRAYVGALTDEERQRFVGCVNLESVGYTDRRPHSQHMPPGSEWLHAVGDRADFVLVLGNQSSQELASAVGLGLGAMVGPDLRVEVYSGLVGAGWILPDSRRSDHASFWDAGLPAVMLTDTAPFRNPWYHRPGDVPETLDGRFLAAVARGVDRALILLLAEG